jgi:hypothetical protein
MSVDETIRENLTSSEPSTTEPDDNEPSDPSLFDRLRQKKVESAENKTLDLDIPGYGGELFCRYKILDNPTVNAIAKNARKESKGDQAEGAYINACDIIIAACEEFFARDNGEEIPLSKSPHVNTSLPVKYDHNLVEILQLEVIPDEKVGPARQALIQLFGENQIAITAHSALVMRWMMKTSLAMDMELGEV